MLNYEFNSQTHSFHKKYLGFQFKLNLLIQDLRFKFDFL